MGFILVTWAEDRAQQILERIGGYGIGANSYAVEEKAAESLKKVLFKAQATDLSVYHITGLSAYSNSMGTPEGFEIVKDAFPNAGRFDFSNRS